ncbi:FAD/NAD(P)-binding domain-containing protein, partial [Coniophora puteana RWD-64-598 SS2]
GGATSCVTAGRLAAADPLLRILILEAGPHTKDLEDHTIPAWFNRNIGPESQTIWNHTSEKSPHLGGRALVSQSGKCVGGGSSVNFMMYTRACASDYDDWKTKYKNPGWGANDLIPLLCKTETYQIGYGNTHGSSGPLKVSFGGIYADIGRQAIDVAQSYDADRPVVPDANDLHTTNAYSIWLHFLILPRPRWIDDKTGKRSDSAHAFIYRQETNKNLCVMTGKMVVRVIIENGRAVGVECGEAEAQPIGTLSISRAKRLVVVSAGSFGSPAILERSGIGQTAILESNGMGSFVRIVTYDTCYSSDIVDHPIAFPAYYAAENSQTIDPLYQGSAVEIDELLDQWRKKGTGICAHNAQDVALKMRPTAQDLEELGPDYKRRYRELFSQNPDKCMALLMPCSGIVGGYDGVPKRRYIGTCYFSCYPLATGSVHIASGTEPSQAPGFIDGFLDNSLDVAVMRLAYKRMREWIRRMPAYRGEVQQRQPVFPPNSQAACKETGGPVVIDAPDIVYSEEDNKAIEAFHRGHGKQIVVVLGTCAMKPRDLGGVVDSRLNVYEISNLKVADLSIAPSNVAANTYSSALLIGEKAAVLIAEEIGLDMDKFNNAKL